MRAHFKIVHFVNSIIFAIESKIIPEIFIVPLFLHHQLTKFHALSSMCDYNFIAFILEQWLRTFFLITKQIKALYLNNKQKNCWRYFSIYLSNTTPTCLCSFHVLFLEWKTNDSLVVINLTEVLMDRCQRLFLNWKIVHWAKTCLLSHRNGRVEAVLTHKQRILS